MEKELYLSRKNSSRAIIQNDDLIFDGKNIEIPSYYASLVLDYISSAPVKSWPEADQEDFNQFKGFFEDIVVFKCNQQKVSKKMNVKKV